MLYYSLHITENSRTLIDNAGTVLHNLNNLKIKKHIFKYDL